MGSDSSGMLIFFMMFVMIAGGLYFFRDKIKEMMGGGAGDIPPEGPPEEMPPEEGAGAGGPDAFTQGLIECAGRCDRCDDVIDPNTGQVYWHAARSSDEKRCFSCLKDKCRHLFPGDPEVIIKKYYQTKVIKKEVPVYRDRPQPEGERPDRTKSPRSGSDQEKAAYARAMYGRRGRYY